MDIIVIACLQPEFLEAAFFSKENNDFFPVAYVYKWILLLSIYL